MLNRVMGNQRRRAKKMNYYKRGKRWYGRNPYLKHVELVCRIVW